MKTLIYPLLLVIGITLISCEKEETEDSSVILKAIKCSFITIENASGDSMNYVWSCNTFPTNSDGTIPSVEYFGGYSTVDSAENITDTITLVITKTTNVNSKVTVIFSTYPTYSIDSKYVGEDEAEYFKKYYYEYFKKESTANPVTIKGVLMPNYPYFKEIKN
jgi:hypothetical protein